MTSIATSIDPQELDRMIQHEWNYVDSKKNEWSLLQGPQDMEVLEHILRCILHLNLTKERGDDFRECVKVQNPDGGWSKQSHDNKTSMWITTFVGLKLCRGNQILRDPNIAAAVDRAMEYVLTTQEEDGHWADPEWSHLDTTCSVTVFQTIYQVMLDRQDDERINNARLRGFEYIANWQRDSGIWKDETFHPAGIETTGHLMQYTLVPAYFMDKISFAGKMCLEAAESLVVEQAANGSWDSENMDHTMDACRCLMLVSDTFKEKEKYAPVIEKGVRWLIDNKNKEGWGDFIDEPSNVERTGDGLDTLLKFKRFCTDEPMAAFWAFCK
ncbi:MAG: terpene cyclase/mutase family protein [Candidatus Nitrohelix vancouverensis]|uniref:Terpene cyclase/mutase family protein n=1 Tax=Candidatus Nitrohelix vancouverensis TaxID=2705534 RepID=A0A7T0BZX2_9BACT|nr:MAG: terpene cyclase/mutase family protein [Candidatus Nitrohelix vancouverensis]